MGIWNSIFGNKEVKTQDNILVDMHNHLLFGLDDGSKSIEETIDLLRGMVELGRKKIIMTPHIMKDFYKNEPKTILETLNVVKHHATENNIPIELEAAAEYYLDEAFISLLERGEKPLTFGSKNYLLFETGFISEPPQLKSVIFEMKSQGIKPIFAHPERYLYLNSSISKYESLFERDICFQINILSLSGYYSPEVKKMAEKLIDAKMVHFVSSDCHNIRHLEALKSSINTKYYQKAIELPLLNNSLL